MISSNQHQRSLGWPTIAGSLNLLGAFGLGMLGAALLLARDYASQSPVWRIALLTAPALALVAFSGIAIAAPSIRLDKHTPDHGLASRSGMRSIHFAYSIGGAHQASDLRSCQSRRSSSRVASTCFSRTDFIQPVSYALVGLVNNRDRAWLGPG